MFILLKNIVYAFLILIIINQLDAMKYQTCIYNSAEPIKFLNNVTLQDLAIDTICEQIRLNCEDKLVSANNPAKFTEIINNICSQNFYGILPLELIERIKKRFIATYHIGFKCNLCNNVYKSRTAINRHIKICHIAS